MSLIRILPFLLLVILVAVSFGNSVGGYFICDDLFHQGYLFRAFNGEPELLLAPFYGPWLKDASFFSFYRPLAELTFASDYAIYGSRAFGYHLTSLSWHMLNACLLFVLVQTLTEVPGFYIAGKKQRSILAFFCAAVWACYPTHCEAVSWISARSDLVATAFYFLTMIVFGKKLQNRLSMPAPLPVLLVTLPVVLGFLTKELTISLPCTLFALHFFSCRSPGPGAWLKSAKEALAETWIYFAVAAVYVLVRTLALGELVGGYVGSVGVALNASLIDRWFLSHSFYKIFHPFNDQLIAPNSALHVALRVIWGLCGVMCVVWARLAGAIAGKYRLMLFCLAWLGLTLVPNLQIWSFSETMAGGRIAYLPTVPIAILIVFAVYPVGWAHSGARAALLKLAGVGTLIALIAVSCRTSFINDQAWLDASQMVRAVRGQAAALTDGLADGQKLLIFNLPINIKGAYTFTSPGMLEGLLKEPLGQPGLADNVIVLDAEPCSYPRINLDDIAAAARHKDLFQLFYFDRQEGKLRNALPVLASGNAGPPTTMMDLHDNGGGGENFRFRINPRISPIDYEYARLTINLSKDAKAIKLTDPAGASKLCYVWDNCPVNDFGENESFITRLVNLPEPGKSASFLIRLGQNKLWLLSHSVGCMQIFIEGLEDKNSSLRLEFVPGQSVHPLLDATVEGESAGEKLLSFKRLSRKAGKPLDLSFDATALAGAQKVKIEILPPYHYFEHYTRLLPAPSLLERDLKVLDCPLSGKISLQLSDFPKAGIYQLRACGIGQNGDICGDFTAPITLRVED